MTDRWLAQGQASHGSLKCPACDLLPFDVLAEDRSPEPTTIDFNSFDIDRTRKWSSRCDFCRALVDLYGHWLSNERDQEMPDQGFAYYNMCGLSEWRMQHADDTYLGLFVDFGACQS
jgi:hypothetical protein